MKTAKRYILIILLCSSSYLNAQQYEFGLSYAPVTLTRISFDQNYFIFSNGNSIILEKPVFRVLPTFHNLFNSGVYLRIDKRYVYFQTELSFQTISYGYAQIRTDYSIGYYFLKYSTFSNPLLAGFRLNPDKPGHLVFTAGIQLDYGNLKMRNFYSVLSPSNQESTHPYEDELFSSMKKVVVYSLAGIGYELYGTTYALLVKHNLNKLTNVPIPYNGNVKDTYIISLSLNFRISPIDLQITKQHDRIKK